jgi:hypothetical protein
MLILKDIPLFIALLLAALLILAGLGFFSLWQSINGHTRSNHWVPGRFFMTGLAGLIVIAFIVLILVSLFNF